MLAAPGATVIPVVDADAWSTNVWLAVDKPVISPITLLVATGPLIEMG